MFGFYLSEFFDQSVNGLQLVLQCLFLFKFSQTWGSYILYLCLLQFLCSQAGSNLVQCHSSLCWGLLHTFAIIQSSNIGLGVSLPYILSSKIVLRMESPLIINTTTSLLACQSREANSTVAVCAAIGTNEGRSLVRHSLLV